MFYTIVNGYRVGPYKDLCHTNLCCADLHKLDIGGANFAYADCRGANLKDVNFNGANLYNTFLDKDQLCRKGEKLKQDIVGYKRCSSVSCDGWDRTGFRYCYFAEDDVPLIVELIIPRGAIVFGINNNKFRTDKAIVKDIYDYKGNHHKRAYSYYKYFSYYVGDEIEVFDFNTEYNVECGEGIHFFKTKEEAINW